MEHFSYHEPIHHYTGDLPLAFYHVDEFFSRYRMTMHWHDEIEFIRIISGSLRFYLDGAEYELLEGDFCVVGSGAIHGGEPESCVYQCLVFDLKALTPIISACIKAADEIARRHLIIKNSKIRSMPLFEEALRSLFEKAGSYRGNTFEVISSLYGVLPYLTDQSGRSVEYESTVPRIRVSEQLKPALEYIEQNYSQRITLEQLASLSGFSAKYFCRYFRAYAHRSPIDYLNYYRIERGAEFLLRGEENVAEIAVKCGFADSSAFIKQFKRCKGITPKQYQLKFAG